MLTIGLVLILVLMVIGCPLFAAFGFGSLLILMFHLNMPGTLIVQSMFTSINKYALLALPLYILVGNLILYSGASKQITEVVRVFFGHWPGGLAVATVGACAIFAGMCGGSVAAVVAIGSIMIPVMRAGRYPLPLATAVAAGAAPLANIIPPSGGFIIISSVIDISLGGLFMAGILPGLLMAVLLAVTAFLVCRRKKVPLSPPASWSERWSALLKALPIGLTPVIILGGIYSGIFTVIESASVACFYAAIVGVFYYRGLNLKTIWSAVGGTAQSSSMVFLMVSGMILSSLAFTILQVPQAVTKLAVGLSPILFMFMTMVVVLILGTFMEAIPLTYITLPILFPVATSMGINEFQFCVIFQMMIVVGQLTPPVAVVLYTACGISGASVLETARDSVPFLGAMVVAAAVLVFVPGMATLIPGLMLR